MAQRIMAAMDQNEWRSKKILRKYSKRRPFAELENQHRFTPRQPVLSSKTVEVDVPGTRTYQARSTEQIMDDHHKFIHSVYTRARSAVSAPPERRTANSPVTPRPNVRVLGLSYLTDSGVVRTLVKKQSPNRPHTSPGTKRILQQLNQLFLRDPEDNGDVPSQSDIYSSEESCRLISELIQNHWTDQVGINNPHGGRNPVTSYNTARQGHWVDSQGTPLPDSEINVLESIVDFQSGDELYTTIDESSSKSISRQLQSGEGIHVGVNGATPHNKWQSSQTSFRDMSEESVPLCWTDQVTRPGVVVLKPKQTGIGQQHKYRCETSSVMFQRLRPEVRPLQNLKSEAKKGYGVKIRSKPRTGLNGEVSNSRITTVTVEKLNAAEVNEDISVDQVIQKCIPKKTVRYKKEVKERHKAIVQAHPPPFQQLMHKAEQTKPVDTCTTPKPDQPQSATNRFRDDDPKLDTLFITNANPETIDTKSRRSSLSRVSSAGRKSASKQGRQQKSVPLNQHQSKPSFIKITSGLGPRNILPRPQFATSQNEIIEEVQKHNETFEEKELDDQLDDELNNRPEKVQTPEPKQSDKTVVSPPPVEVSPAPEMPSDEHFIQQMEKRPITTPPPSPQQKSPEVTYAFNIPTADVMDYDRESSIYQASDQVSLASFQAHSVHKFSPSLNGDMESKVGSIDDTSRSTTPFTEYKSEIGNSEKN